MLGPAKELQGFGPVNSKFSVMGGVAIDYMIGKFFQAGASYSLNLNRTTTAPTSRASDGTTHTSELNYTKHVLLFRLGLMY